MTAHSEQTQGADKPSHDYLRNQIILASLQCSSGFFDDPNIDESETFYNYAEAVADKVMIILESESVL